jgi:hypothetical protein
MQNFPSIPITVISNANAIENGNATPNQGT